MSSGNLIVQPKTSYLYVLRKTKTTKNVIVWPPKLHFHSSETLNICLVASRAKEILK